MPRKGTRDQWQGVACLAGWRSPKREAMMRALALAAWMAGSLAAQNAAGFDPHDLSGHWNRTSRFQTFSNVPSGTGQPAGGAAAATEAPFTAAGKARFEKNLPGYGPRAVPPALGND